MNKEKRDKLLFEHATVFMVFYALFMASIILSKVVG